LFEWPSVAERPGGAKTLSLGGLFLKPNVLSLTGRLGGATGMEFDINEAITL
jgi:hypothetical protein